jgi:hypothetical protein
VLFIIKLSRVLFGNGPFAWKFWCLWHLSSSASFLFFWKRKNFFCYLHTGYDIKFLEHKIFIDVKHFALYITIYCNTTSFLKILLFVKNKLLIFIFLFFLILEILVQASQIPWLYCKTWSPIYQLSSCAFLFDFNFKNLLSYPSSLSIKSLGPRGRPALVFSLISFVSSGLSGASIHSFHSFSSFSI